MQVACKRNDKYKVMFTKSNLIYWSRYWLFDTLQLLSIEIYLYFTFLRARLLLNESCFVYWLYLCHSRYEFVEDSFVKFSFEISYLFLISFARDLKMIMLVEMIRLINKFARFVELFSSMRLWSCQWLNVTYSYSRRERNMIFFWELLFR